MTTRSSHIKGMVKDSYQYYLENYEKVPTVFNQIFQEESTNASYEQYTTAIGPGSLTEIAEGVSIPRSQAQEGYTVYCAVKKYPAELPITNEALDDNQKIDNMLKTWAGGLGDSVRESQETTHADIFNKGAYLAGDSAFNNSIPGVITPSYGSLIYDGKPFFALSGNNHTAKNNATYYNSIATLTLNGQGLETLMKLISVTNAYNEAGMKVSIMPDTLLCQFGSSNYWNAKRLLESAGDSNEPHSGITNVWKRSLNLVGWRFLDDADAWFIGCSKKGLVSLSRMSPKIDYYEDQNTDIQIVRMRTRWGRAVTNFRYWVSANQSTS